MIRDLNGKEKEKKKEKKRKKKETTQELEKKRWINSAKTWE